MTTRAKANLLTITASLLLFAGYEYHRISTFLASSEPSDVYDKTWGFQLMVTGIFHFPVFLLFLSIALFTVAAFTCARKAISN